MCHPLRAHRCHLANTTELLLHSAKPPSKASFPRLTRVLNSNGISIGSAVFAGLICVTDRQTDHTTRSVIIGCIYVHSTAMRPNSNNYYIISAVLSILNEQVQSIINLKLHIWYAVFNTICTVFIVIIFILCMFTTAIKKAAAPQKQSILDHLYTYQDIPCINLCQNTINNIHAYVHGNNYVH